LIVDESMIRHSPSNAHTYRLLVFKELRLAAC